MRLGDWGSTHGAEGLPRPAGLARGRRKSFRERRMKQHNRKLVQAVKQALAPVNPGIAPGAAVYAGMLFALGAGVAAAAYTEDLELTALKHTVKRALCTSAITTK